MWLFRHLGCGGFQLRDQALQSVGVFLPRHQDRILRRDHHEVIDTFQRDQRPVGQDVAVAQIFEHAAPRAALPSPSFSDNSHTACQEPTSDQPHATGTTAAREVFSITA